MRAWNGEKERLGSPSEETAVGVRGGWLVCRVKKKKENKRNMKMRWKRGRIKKGWKKQKKRWKKESGNIVGENNTNKNGNRNHRILSINWKSN